LQESGIQNLEARQIAQLAAERLFEDDSHVQAVEVGGPEEVDDPVDSRIAYRHEQAHSGSAAETQYSQTCSVRGGRIREGGIQQCNCVVDVAVPRARRPLRPPARTAKAQSFGPERRDDVHKTSSDLTQRRAQQQRLLHACAVVSTVRVDDDGQAAGSRVAG
jgi:hypothetical protein